jgi:hypothetical protein
MAQLNFNAAEVAPDAGRADPIPAGWYIAAMEKSELKPTKDGTGSLLACTFGVLDGQYKGRKVFFNFNLRNANPQAQEIAYKQFSAVCHAIGHLMVGDTAELHNRPLKIRVKVRPADAQYEAANDITAFKNVNEPTGDAPTAPQAAPSFMPPPPAAPPQAWAPPAAAPAPQAWAPPPAAMSPAAPPQQQWAPQPPAAPPAAMPPAPAQQPSWQPPAGAQPQPWAAPAQAPASPPAAAPVPPMPPANMPPAWAPPPAQGGTPPWMQQPPPQA